MEGVQRTKRRVLVLLVLLLVIAIFWSRDFFHSSPQTPAAPTSSTDAHFGLTPQSPGFGSSNGTASGYHDPLADYPDPKQFSTFTYTAGTSGKITRTEWCNDTYYALLIFPQGVDYRKSVTSSVYNSASPCKKGEKIIINSDVSSFHLSPGSYYYFIADEGSGAWYNPR